jgi:hypothetical protein
MRAQMRTTIARLGAATLVGALSLAAAPGPSALAGTARGAGHSKQHKRKAKPQVLVHCAAVTITCKPNAHDRGPTGPTGPAGGAGTPGAGGHGVAYRLRSAGAVTSADGTPTAIGLSPASFNQEAGQDERLLGLVSVTMPAGECKTGEKDAGTLSGKVTVDGKEVGIIEAGGSPYSPGSAQTVPILWTGGLAEAIELAADTGVLPIAATAQTHTLAIAVQDDCDVSGAAHFTVNSVAIDVLSAH